MNSHHALPDCDRRFMKLLGRCVRERRQAKRLSQEELAFRAGLSRGESQFVENGGRCPKLDTIKRCCEGLGIGIMELFGEVDRRVAEEGLEAHACVVARA